MILGFFWILSTERRRDLLAANHFFSKKSIDWRVLLIYKQQSNPQGLFVFI
jgi:hypothetical protein